MARTKTTQGITCEFYPDEAKRLRDFARQEKSSVSRIIRLAVDQYIMTAPKNIAAKPDQDKS